MSEDIVERLRRKVFRGPTIQASHTKTVEWQAADEIESLRAEVEEQARLNGMGAERELALQAEVERLRIRETRLREALDILQAAMVAKKPILMPFKIAINQARAALGEGKK